MGDVGPVDSLVAEAVKSLQGILFDDGFGRFGHWQGLWGAALATILRSSGQNGRIGRQTGLAVLLIYWGAIGASYYCGCKQFGR